MVVVPILRIGGPSSSRHLGEIYNNIKDEYPDFLKKDFEYSDGVPHMAIPMYSTLKSYDYIINMIESYGLHKYFLETTYYSKQEICNAEYYDMRFSCALEAAGTRASSYGTKYHSCCQECNIDGIPIGDILVDRKYVKKYSIASLKPDIIVSKQVKWLIESNNLTGVEFNHIVRDFKGRDIPEYYRLTINNYLDPVDNRTILSYSPPAKVCQECGRVVPYLRSNLYYKKAAFDSASDFNLTYELFDNWYEHNVVVSKKVKNIFTKYKVHAWFKMINIVEEIERQGTKGDFDISGTKGDVPFLSLY